jgi:formamidopyrimidine-DNA glycosylase
MAELPEIYLISQQMKSGLVGKTISNIEVIQPKCLNISPEAFTKFLVGSQITDVTYRGKWIFCQTNQGWLLLCLGMGGEILLVDRATLPEKWRVIVDFIDKSCLVVNFWWFGYVHYTEDLKSHKMTASLGPNAIDLDSAGLEKLLSGKRGQIKTWLLNQSRIAGIGNFYIHDILFQAKLHPLRSIQSLKPFEVNALADAIQSRLQLSIHKGGFAYELDLFGRKGNFGMDDLIIAYKEDKSCPVCGTGIQKIKTGSTSSFVCTNCQPL